MTNPLNEQRAAAGDAATISGLSGDLSFEQTKIFYAIINNIHICTTRAELVHWWKVAAAKVADCSFTFAAGSFIKQQAIARAKELGLPVNE